MSSIKTRAVVGPDGVLHLDLPIGRELAGREVAVTLRPNGPGGPPHPDNDASYLALLDELHGGIDDPSFEYPIPGLHEPVPRW